MNTDKSNDTWPLPMAEPEKVGFSSERLAMIHPTMQKFIDDEKVPNIIALVARHGKIVHFEAQGYMDIESKQPVKEDAFFRLYSNTKPITGIATMILYEEGLLNLDDPVSKYIPAFSNPQVLTTQPTIPLDPARAYMVPTAPARRGITIRDCLRNTTGLLSPMRAPIQLINEQREAVTAAGWLQAITGAPPAPTFKERVENLAKLPLSANPGTEWLYHSGYPIVGVVLEMVAGKNLEEFYRERIFGPLNMKDASFYLPEGQLDRFPDCYRPHREGHEWKLEVADRAETSEKVKGPKQYFPAGGDMGGLLSTIADYARIGQMLLNGGELDGVRILGRKSVEMMTSNHTGDMPIPMLGQGFGFGMGVCVRTGIRKYPTMRSMGAYGWGGAAGTTYFADPKEDLFGLCFTQVLNHMMMPGNTYQETFERLVYQALV